MTDYMPVGAARERDDFHRLIRRVSVVRGSLSFRVECQPAFNFAREPHRTDIVAGGACFRSRNLQFGLATKIPVNPYENGIRAEFTLNEGETTVFVLRANLGGIAAAVLSSTNRKRRNCLERPCITGGTGSPDPPTPDAGAKWWSARRWR